MCIVCNVCNLCIVRFACIVCNPIALSEPARLAGNQSTRLPTAKLLTRAEFTPWISTPTPAGSSGWDVGYVSGHGKHIGQWKRALDTNQIY